MTFSIKIKQSEQNLAAQHQVTLQQQRKQTEETIKLQQEREVMGNAVENGINMPELDVLLQPIMDSCTKESISQGKAWILHYVVQPRSSSDTISQCLLYKSVQNSKFILFVFESNVVSKQRK